jgi:hypothetical protein
MLSNQLRVDQAILTGIYLHISNFVKLSIIVTDVSLYYVHLQSKGSNVSLYDLYLLE